MAFEFIGTITAIALALSIVLIGLSRAVTNRFTKRFTEGDLKEVGKWVVFSMTALIGKLVSDFLIIIIGATDMNPPEGLISFLWFAGILFVILTGLCLIKVSLNIKILSHKFGFDKE